MKFQAELVNFQHQLEILFCVNIFISSELGSSTKRDQLKNLKMRSNDIITNSFNESHVNNVNTIISMQTKHEALLVTSIIHSFCG